MSYTHIPVLLDEVIRILDVHRGKQYIDATLGGGGYTGAIIEKGGLVLGIDLDKNSVLHVAERHPVEVKSGKLVVVQGNFKDIKKIALLKSISYVSGIVFDLGLSSYHLDQSGRGFSMLSDSEPLDMRMQIGDGLGQFTAADIVNSYTQGELYNLFLKGEEHFAEKIAAEIVKNRRLKRIETTGDLVKIITSVVKRTGDLHPATKVFQALRIEVNNELENLQQGLVDAFDLLEQRGRVVVVSFHSLEERIAKRTFDLLEKKGVGRLFEKLIRPTSEEMQKNRRSRSAKLRVIEKL